MSNSIPTTQLHRTASTVLRAAALQFLLLSAVSSGAHAQERPDLWLVAHGDTVLVLVPEPPATNHGFVVYRGAPGAPPELLTDRAVLPVRQPAYAAGLLGDDLPRVMEMLDATDETQMLRRLQADRVAAGVASTMFRQAAVVLGRFYADTTAQRGAEYEYRVVFLDAAGEESGEARSGRVRVADVEPQAVTGAAGVAGNFEAMLSWRYPVYRGAPLDFVLGFNLYRADDDEPEFRRITEVPLLRSEVEEQRYLDRQVRNDVAYRYRIRAVDLAGREGAATDIAAVRPVDDRPPSVPAGLVTEPGDGRVTLAWRMSPELNVAGYVVERSTGLDQPYDRVVTDLLPATSPTWTDTAVRGGTQYFYRVIAVNEQGRESRPSNGISALPFDDTPPEPPSDVVASAAGRRAEVRWAASSSDDVQGYHVYRGEANGESVRLTTRPVAGTEYVDDGFEGRGLRPGGRYVIRVSAVDHSFNESETVPAELVIPDDEPPAAPTALQARGVEGRFIEVEWMPGGSPDVERYVLTRGAAGTAGDHEIAVVTASATLRLRDSDVQRGSEYVYRLVAVDSAGNRSNPAEARVVLRGIDPPPAPRHAAAREDEVGVRVQWERVVDDELVGYRIYRATLSTGVYQPVSGILPAGSLSFVDADGQPGHFYTVRAIDRSGNESRPSPAAEVRRR
jgi:fibronectin type 3 domain-containing protein